MRNKVAAGLAIVFCALVLAACEDINLQNKTAFAAWTAETNNIGVTLRVTVFDAGANLYGTIALDSEEIDIVLHWRNKRFAIEEVGWYGISAVSLGESDVRCAGGSYKVIEARRVELMFTNDALFDGRLENRKIVLIASDINADEYPVGERNGVLWGMENARWQVITYNNGRRFSVGTLLDADTRREFIVYWNDDGTFTGYALENETQAGSVLLSGASVHEGNTLNITFRQNLLTEDTQLTLYGESDVNSSWLFDYPYLLVFLAE